MNVWKDIRLPLVAGLVTTVSPDGKGNAAPGTWWTPTSYDPPLMVIVRRPESDTALNVQETGTWVMHFPPLGTAKQVLHTAKKLPRGECELDDVGLKYDWFEHPMLPIPMPVVREFPFVICWATTMMPSGDHLIFEGQVGVAGGFSRADGVPHVLLHRGVNVFTSIGREYEVERY